MKNRFILFQNWIKNKSLLYQTSSHAFWKKQDSAFKENPRLWHWKIIKISMVFMALYLSMVAVALIYLQLQGA